MKYLWATCLLLASLLAVTRAHPPNRLDRLARLVMPNRHSLARSLEGGYSSLARRQQQNDADNNDVGNNDFEDAEDDVTIGKRNFDDYGHMRFGRNTGVGNSRDKKYDDYGHMRYGK